MLAGLVIALVLTERADDDELKLDQVALHADAKLVAVSAGESIMHCGWDNKNSLCFEGARQRGATRSVLWVGNSQVPTINEYKPGQTTAAPELQARLASHGLDLTVIWQPNAGLQEHLVAYAHAAAHLPLKAVVVSLVFDDTRETGLNPRLLESMLDPQVIARLEKYPIGQRIVAAWRAQNAAQEAAESSASDKTLQDRSEGALTGWLEANSAVWRAREQARGKLFVALYLTRNAVFGIKPESKRRLIESRYRDNLDAVEAILTDAKAQGVTVLGYIAPLRPGIASPYLPEEYARFKGDVAAMFARHGAVLENLESLVPERDWGTMKMGTEKAIDFMHFMESGHRRIAVALARLILDHVPTSEGKP